MPIHPASAWTQTLQPDTHRAAANLGLAEIDAETLLSVTCTELNEGSRPWVKESVTCRGAAPTDPPTDGVAFPRAGVSVRAASAQAKQ